MDRQKAIDFRKRSKDSKDVFPSNLINLSFNIECENCSQINQFHFECEKKCV